MSLELQRFQETLRDHARRNDNAPPCGAIR
jgi:hypothetical protein